MSKPVASRGERRGEAVEKHPAKEAAQRAARAAGRAPIDARTGRAMEDPDEGRLERPDGGTGEGSPDNEDRDELSPPHGQEPHDHTS